MQAISSYPAYFSQSYPFQIPIKNFDKIKIVANSALTELGIAMAFNLTIHTTFGVFLLLPSVHFMTAGCGFAAIGLGALLVIKAAQTYFPSFTACQKATINFTLVLENVSRSLARLTLVNTATLKLSLYIHECGHAAAALVCYLQADPLIVVKWNEAATTYNISYGLTSFGKFLGEHKTMLLVTSAGLLTPVIFALAEFTAAYLIHERHPLISEILNYHGVSQILNLSLYGIQAFGVSKSILRHDFIRLWVLGGIHPLVPLTLIVLVPLGTFGVFKLLKSAVNQQVTQS